MSEASRLRELTEAGLLHANPAAVVSPLFTAGGEFFLAADKVQVKYEMLRAHLADGAAGHRRRGGARLFARGVLPGAGVVLAGGHVGAAGRAARPARAGEAAAGDRGVHPRRRRGPGLLAEQVADRFGVRLHRRTIERARVR